MHRACSSAHDGKLAAQARHSDPRTHSHLCLCWPCFGYLNYRRIQVAPGTVLIADVGEKGYNSYVAISGGDTLTAEPGQDAQDWDGGAGYCGGGGEGSPAADGGTDGGEGRMHP